jgi:phosphoribosylglycinamide formyltransferase 1
MKERLGILISGGGTTMAEIIKACQSGEIPNTEIACIIASNPGAGGIEKAKKLSIPSEDIVVIEPDKTNRNAFGMAIIKELKSRGVSLVTQNGWLPLTPGKVIEAFSGMIFNQHPGPVPEFGGKGMYGRRVHASVLYFFRETGQKNPYTEVIGQRVAAKFDQGAVIQSAPVEILDGDTADDLQQRALPIEHRVQINMLKDIVTGNIREIRRAKPLVLPGQENILEQAKHAAVLLYPKG